MANSINTNVGAMVALQNLNATGRDLKVTQDRVSTGLKVGSAKDNGAIWAISQNQKANMGVLNATRNALQRTMSVNDVGLAAGEPPTAKGYPPSVFGLLPGLLERAGNVQGKGSITGIYTVLVEGDDTNEPVADSVRGILDGHVVLSRALGARNHYPAIDILSSVSRTMPDVTTAEHRLKAGTVRDWLSLVRENEDLVSVGAYVAGSSARIDDALAHRETVDAFLRQPAGDLVDYDSAVEALTAL